MATLESRIVELERQYGTGCKLVLLADDETEAEALERLGLVNWKGPLIFLSEADAQL